MSMPQQVDAPIEGLAESESLGAVSCLGVIELASSINPGCGGIFFPFASKQIADVVVEDLQQKWHPALEATQISIHDSASNEFSAPDFSQSMDNPRKLLNERQPYLYQDLQLSEYGIFNATCDPPMSFRDRHRFLYGIFNSYPDSDLITAKEIGEVSRKVGLLREEVLSWFGDEKLRRMELLAKPQHREQKLGQLPPPPETTRATSEISYSSSTYNATSPGVQSQSLVIFSHSPVVTDQKRMALLTPKRGRPAKAHVETESDLSLPDAKRRKISMKCRCPDCMDVFALERWAKPIDRKHIPENVWECPKTNPRTGKPCSSNHRPFYRHDNFAAHLRGEHDCPDSEVVVLKRTCKFEVTDFYKTCGFCEKRLETRDECIEHVKDHFVVLSRRPDPPADLGLSLWKEKCGFEHKLQLGIHYRRSPVSNPGPRGEGYNHDEDENGGSGDGTSDNPGPGSSDFRPNNYNNEDRRFGEDSSETPGHHSSDFRFNNDNHELPTFQSHQPVPNLYTQGRPPGSNFSCDQSKEKGRCTYPECGKLFKDLKAHIMTHQHERPEKCPIQTCDYHIKGFARKYDKNRHTLGHYKGRMVCGFCSGSGSPAEKSFSRADFFKRHLTSVHAVEQMPPNSRRKTSSTRSISSSKRFSAYGPHATGKCSTCQTTFISAQDFYEHLDDCILRVVQEGAKEAINVAHLSEVKQD
jgi:hypothetical protein